MKRYDFSATEFHYAGSMPWGKKMLMFTLDDGSRLAITMDAKLVDEIGDRIAKGDPELLWQ
jgi:hypothetical protein